MMKMNATENENDNSFVKNDVLRVTQSDNRKQVDFYLINDIEDIHDYIDFLREVRDCRQGDLITVHINCYGGNVDVALNIYDELKMSEADVKISVEGMCASCASMIMLSGDLWNVYPHSRVMIHAWSGVECGKWNEIVAQHNYDKDIFEFQFRELYKDFLTTDEIEDCIKGKDFFFDCDETIKRLNSFKRKDIEYEKMIKKITDKYSEKANKEIESFLKKNKIKG